MFCVGDREDVADGVATRVRDAVGMSDRELEIVGGSPLGEIEMLLDTMSVGVTERVDSNVVVADMMRVDEGESATEYVFQRMHTQPVPAPFARSFHCPPLDSIAYTMIPLEGWSVFHSQYVEHDPRTKSCPEKNFLPRPPFSFPRGPSVHRKLFASVSRDPPSMPMALIGSVFFTSLPSMWFVTVAKNPPGRNAQ